MALQGKYKNIDTGEIYENAYYLIDTMHTEVIFNGEEENFIFVSMSVYESIEKRNERIDVRFDLSFDFKCEKDKNFENLWEFSYNQVKPLIIEKMSDQLDDDNYSMEDV